MFSWKLLLSILLAGVISIWAHMSYKSSGGVSLDGNSPNKAQPVLFLLNGDSFEKIKHEDKKGNRARKSVKADLNECIDCSHTQIPILKAMCERNTVSELLNNLYDRYAALDRDLYDNLGCNSVSENAIANEVNVETLENMRKYRLYLNDLMSRLKICISSLGLNNPNRKKPNYEQVFCDELESPDIQELYTDLKHELSKTAKTRSILSSFEECMAIIRSQAKMCSDKWDWERRIEEEANGSFYFRNDLPNDYDAHDMAYGAQIPKNTEEKNDEVNDEESAESTSWYITDGIRRLNTNAFVAKTEYNDKQEKDDNDKKEENEATTATETKAVNDTNREKSEDSKKEETAEASDKISGEANKKNEFEPEGVNENDINPILQDDCADGEDECINDETMRD